MQAFLCSIDKRLLTDCLIARGKNDCSDGDGTILELSRDAGRYDDHMKSPQNVTTQQSLFHAR